MASGSLSSFRRPSAPTTGTTDGDVKHLSSFAKRCSLVPETTPTSAPSAPFGEPAAAFSYPVTQVELTVSANSLLNLDQLTESDPLCVIFLQDSTTANEWIELGRTETIFNNLNPSWKAKFLVDYRFEERQLLTFMVYDKDCKKCSLDNHDFLGRLECSLGEVVSAPHSKFTQPLKLPSIHAHMCHSTITICAEEIGDCKKTVGFHLNCSSLAQGGACIALSSGQQKQLFVSISKQIADSSWVLLHRTDRVPINDCTFPPVALRYSSLCKKGNLEMPLRFQLHLEAGSVKGRTSKLIGECVTNFIALSEAIGSTKYSFPLKSERDEVVSSMLDIWDFRIYQQKSFMDYLTDGLQLQFAVAIDFTSSNGEPTKFSSLHYKHGKADNPYVMSLKYLGKILEDYSSTKDILAYGFGAKGFPVANRVNHKFPLNFKETNPACQGIDGVLAAYSRVLQRVKLFGPTCFAPVIRELTEIARSAMGNSPNKYFVLLILTDGNVCDPETTIDALVKAADVPLSIIIIGIGDEDFTAMEKLDSDEKLLKSRSQKRASRDIVQFVELNKFVNFKSIQPISSGSKVALARAVLAELPHQVVTWMNRVGKTTFNEENMK